MMRLMTLTVIVVVVIGISAVGAQNNDPVTSSLQRIRGVVKAVSVSSLSLELGDKEILFTIDSSTSLSNPNGKSTLTNDLVYRGPRRITDYVKRGDRVTITYRESGDVLHAVQIRVAQK
jgi:hypothetical protein